MHTGTILSYTMMNAGTVVQMLYAMRYANYLYRYLTIRTMVALTLDCRHKCVAFLVLGLGTGTVLVLVVSTQAKGKGKADR